jgi:2,4-dienoyl-CoA reductase (NADPH2)
MGIRENRLSAFRIHVAGTFDQGQHRLPESLNTRVTAKELKAGDFDKIVIATGIEPRVPDIEGIGHEKVCGYIDVINGRTSLGRSVAIAGAGGIGFDIAELVSHSGIRASLDVDVCAFR